MNSKQRVRRYNIRMFAFIVGPVMLVFTLALLAAERQWPTWLQYAFYGLMFITVPLVSRLIKRETDSVMYELPVRDDNATFDPEHPMISAVELRRYERASRTTYGRKGLALQLLPMGMLFVVLFVSPSLSAELEWLATYVVFGLFFSGIERSLAFEKRNRSQVVEEAGYQPRWWPLYTLATTVTQWCLWAGFIAMVIVTVTGIYWPAAPFIVGAIAGWFLARYGFGRLERYIFTDPTTS
jgi:hypothetical protein